MRNRIKKILVIDDSALMRRIVCDIIEEDGRYHVSDTAADGRIALNLLEKNTYDLLILDINMPNMNGIEFLKELRRRRLYERVVVFSTDTTEGARITIEALELGALDFIHKPNRLMNSKKEDFKKLFFEILENVMNVPLEQIAAQVQADITGERAENRKAPGKEVRAAGKTNVQTPGRSPEKIDKLVLIACSTGGPRALQKVIPLLPENLDAPVLVVQHMPAGFTATLAERLESMGSIACSEAKDGEKIEKGHVYIAAGGRHMKYTENPRPQLLLSDEPPREGVKPCANYLFESVAESRIQDIICVVMTGMGADGTKGILHLAQYKKLHIIAQEEKSCTVFGMPKSIIETGLVNQIADLDHIAQEIISKVGVK